MKGRFMVKNPHLQSVFLATKKTLHFFTEIESDIVCTPDRARYIGSNEILSLKLIIECTMRRLGIKSSYICVCGHVAFDVRSILMVK